MMMHRMILIAAAGLLLTALAAQLGNPSSSLGQAALAANAPAQSTQAKKPVYQPPLRGAPTRRVGGATRGIGEVQLKGKAETVSVYHLMDFAGSSGEAGER